MTSGRPQISRYLVIVLALGATAARLGQQAWVEATGLGTLAAGLIILHLAQSRPALKPVAWVAFSITVITMGIVFLRMQAG